MGREILFRGKRKSDGKWIFGNLLQTDDDCTYIIQNHVPHHLLKNFEVDSETVCQYTGLTDKNGRKIFEGDVVDRKEKFPEIVIFHNGDWTLDYSYASGKESGYNYCNLGFYAKERGGVKVIGNIFDNPELLNQ